MSDFLHKWADVVNHYKLIDQRNDIIKDLVQQNNDQFQRLQSDMDELLRIYKEREKRTKGVQNGIETVLSK